MGPWVSWARDGVLAPPQLVPGSRQCSAWAALSPFDRRADMAQTGPKTCPGAHYRVGAEAASGSPGSPPPPPSCRSSHAGRGSGPEPGAAGVGVPGIPRVSPRACSRTHVHRRRSLCAPSAPPGSPHRPKYKGKYCVGERKRFRLCSLQACPPGRPSFRQVQCSRFDGMLYKGQLHKWVPVVNDGESCCPRATAAPGAGSWGPEVTHPNTGPRSPAISLAESQPPQGLPDSHLGCPSCDLCLGPQ